MTNDVIMAPIWLAVNGLLLWGSWRTAHHWFPGDHWMQRVGHATLLFYAVIVVVGTVIGAVNLLYPWVYLALGTCAAAAVALVSRDARLEAPPIPPAPSGTGPVAEPGSAWPDRIWFVVWGLVFWFWVSHVVINGVLKFPTDWDTLMYHLPLVNHWVQDHNLYAPYCLRWSEPGNNELFALWVVAPFSGDFLYCFNNLPAAVLLACGAAELGRALGLSGTVRNLTALTVVANFVVLNQLQDAENDVAAAAFLLTALAYVFRLARAWGTPALALGVTSLGLLAGTKFYALGYACVGIATALMVLPAAHGWRSTLWAAVAGVTGLVVFSGYWYARNFVVTGTPLFPFGARTDGEDLTQTYPAVWESTFAGNGSPELLDLSLAAVWDLTGPCHWAALVCAPLTVCWLLATGVFEIRSRAPERILGFLRIGLAVATVAAVAVLVVTPFAVEDVPGTLNQMNWKYCPVRYGLCFLSLCVVGLAVVAEDIVRGLSSHLGAALGTALSAGNRCRLSLACRAGFTALLTLVIAWQCYRQSRPDRFGLGDSMLLAVNLLLVSTNIVLAIRAAKYFSGFFVFIACVGGVAALSLGLIYVSDQWHGNHSQHYDKMLAGELNRHLETRYTPGTAIAVLDNRCYPLFGSYRQFRVLQMPPTKSVQYWEGVVRSQNVLLILARFDAAKDSRSWHRIQPWFSERTDLFRELKDLSTPYTVFIVESK